jgi:hypothetical protein
LLCYALKKKFTKFNKCLLLILSITLLITKCTKKDKNECSSSKSSKDFFKVALIFAPSRVHLHFMLKVKTFCFFCVGHSSENSLVKIFFTLCTKIAKNECSSSKSSKDFCNVALIFATSRVHLHLMLKVKTFCRSMFWPLL